MIYPVIIGLGSNLGDKENNLVRAISQIENTIGKVRLKSRWVITKALTLNNEDPDQYPDYLNGVIVVESELEAIDILNQLLLIEKNLGRVRELGNKWCSRTMDLDLIAYDSLVLNSERLTLPHPEMHKRNFVLELLVDLLPGWKHPIIQKSTLEMLQDL